MSDEPKVTVLGPGASGRREWNNRAPVKKQSLDPEGHRINVEAKKPLTKRQRAALEAMAARAGALTRHMAINKRNA